ncbi:molecular chaperone Tir [Mycobacterium rhizamassiliense]|uniref:Molecular chaperone Tir n=1 Tax=Mycobacterium rhizamassiliense TaxID=1841860 RepID=A0A2U3NW86_9MYCO|nr:DUF1883 domain-containing protein [Mycobacterium rhizamassiliense]SPM35779.1 molecular chaperone Tir [Mycobacterium rhizamassiliense]
MEHLKFDLGQQPAGATVEVTLGLAANVKLMCHTDYRRYEAGRDYHCYGGYYDRSPALLTIPSLDNWYIAVDLGGHAGEVRASVRVIPPVSRTA